MRFIGIAFVSVLIGFGVYYILTRLKFKEPGEDQPPPKIERGKRK